MTWPEGRDQGPGTPDHIYISQETIGFICTSKGTRQASLKMYSMPRAESVLPSTFAEMVPPDTAMTLLSSLRASWTVQDFNLNA